MNGMALFAGIGGLELGLHLAIPGYRSVCHVERDAYAAASLVARMEDKTLEEAPIWDDVGTFDGKPWHGVVDLISGGFPCQDISTAGKGAGIEGARSGLWSEYARIIREVGPRYVFVENVPALTTRGLNRVLGDLASLGFDAEWDCFSAAGVGAPHKRLRIFILAQRVSDTIGDTLREEPRRWSGSSDRPGAPQTSDVGIASVGDSDRSRRAVYCGFAEHPGCKSEPGCSKVGDSDRRRREGERLTQHPDELSASGNEPHGHDPHGRFAWPPGPGDTEGWRAYLAAGGPSAAVPHPARMQREEVKRDEQNGIDEGGRANRLANDVESSFRGSPNGFPSGLEFRVDRLRCLGNAVVPQVAARAFITLSRRLVDA